MLRYNQSFFTAFLISFLLSLFTCHANPIDGESLEEVAVSDKDFPEDSEILPVPSPETLFEIKSLILVGNESEYQSLRGENFESLEVIGLPIPGGKKKLEQTLFPFFLDKKLNSEDILILRNAILEYYIENGMPLIAIEIPSQEVTNGVLAFIVQVGKLGEIRVTGNKWTNGEKLKEKIGIKPSEVINNNILSSDVEFINTNPFRSVDAVYVSGKEKGITDIDLITQDRFPLRVYVATDNHNTGLLGRNRWMIGAIYGNLFGLDQVLSYQFTKSYTFKKFEAHTGRYTIPLPWRHLVDIFGGYSSAHVKIHPFMRSKGMSSQASIRYRAPLYSLSKYGFKSEVSGGFDWKRTNNSLDFVENFPRITSAVNLSQFIAQYQAFYTRPNLELMAQIEGVFSPFQLLPEESNSRFQALRSFAKNKYFYAKFFITSTYYLPKEWSLAASITSQVSTANLLPSELLGLGGYDSVRGYEERAYNADNGVIVNVELKTPSLLSKKRRDLLYALIFVDYGVGGEHKSSNISPNNAYLLGCGPGLRYNFQPYLVAKLDWGFKLHRKAFFGGGNSLLYFSLTAGY